MSTFRSHKIRLEPNNRQVTQFKKAAGCARYAYNWAIGISERIYAECGESISDVDLNKMFVRLQKSRHDWLYEVSKCCVQQAIRNYFTAKKRFFALQKPHNFIKTKCCILKSGEKIFTLVGLPQKKKRGISDSFYLEKDGIIPLQTSVSAINLPKIGWVRLSEKLPLNVSIKNCVISRKADDWFISFRQEFVPTRHENQGHVGVDLGIKKLATLSTGVVFESPQKFKTLNRKLRREQKALSRKFESWKKLGDKFAPKSANYKKNKSRLAKLHKRISDHRNDGMHKLTTYLTKNHSEVVIEDLNVSGMLKNGNLSKSIANGSFYEFRRQLDYKGAWYGCEIIIANRFFASSKICNNCGTKNENLKLSDRSWSCKNCGVTHNRDENAAKNLCEYPKKYAASFAVKACGEGSSVKVSRSPSLRQETNTNLA